MAVEHTPRDTSGRHRRNVSGHDFRSPSIMTRFGDYAVHEDGVRLLSTGGHIDAATILTCSNYECIPEHTTVILPAFTAALEFFRHWAELVGFVPHNTLHKERP